MRDQTKVPTLSPLFFFFSFSRSKRSQKSCTALPNCKQNKTKKKWTPEDNIWPKIPKKSIRNLWKSVVELTHGLPLFLESHPTEKELRSLELPPTKKHQKIPVKPFEFHKELFHLIRTLTSVAERIFELGLNHPKGVDATRESPLILVSLPLSPFSAL